ncbi:MAG: ABC transporter permease [Sutterella parvirubra]|uniref:Efflux ABC transporter, permease protein n=1 Tax=Sutterella parvirubra YIT 11816 TaxID=762967 RepID=H3KBQ5_9BURK|nr:ABC transporter permease [Sutterella parvirubra]EHY32452.1 efflux ABC transporter, permease protein [Sutterella parvirubra YIT 11816]MCI7708687.1 ABC transporter permease [Sutterella parvirubra]MDR3770776.1 ABC transporter permease [Sutterella sp.]MDY5200641.1 ABC transporter permease [Sutterella parvirubra]
MIWNAFLLALRQIWRNPMRSLLTVLGVVIGVAAVVTMVTVGNGASDAIRTQIESFGNNQLMLRPGMRLGPGQKVGAPDFKLEDAEALVNQLAGIEAVAPQTSKSLTIVAEGRNWQTSVIGTDNNYFTIDNRELESGRYFEDAELMAGSAVCVIGGTIQRELFGANVDPVGKSLRTGGFSCRVVGLLKTKGTAAMGGDQDDLVVMPLKTVQRRILGESRVASLMLRINADSDRERLKDAVRDLMRERRSLSEGDDDNFQIMDTAEIAAKVASTTQIMTTLLAAVAAVSLVVGGIGIMNIMLVSVTERTREIGIRLAIGALGREVQLQFLIEALVLGCLGGILGLVVALGASKILASVMSVPFLFNPGINLLAFTVSALTGVVFGYFPARRAAKLDPIEAVRHE